MTLLKPLLLLTTIVFVMGQTAHADFEVDTISTSAGDLKITFIGHGTLMFTFGDKVIHVDPFSDLTDYSKLPKADLILITHEHRDHLDPAALSKVKKDSSIVITNENAGKKLTGGIVMKNGETQSFNNIKIDAVPAYNLIHKRDTGAPFHPKGEGNGYVITFGDKKIYVAGDTENIPEMRQLKDIDVAFLPMNLPFTMTPEMVVEAVQAINPKILYPYHTGNTDISKLQNLMKNSAVAVRFRKMQ
jgi:L-ascorbate metabolism protein UlaG (beta-lactamase superfamily)